MPRGMLRRSPETPVRGPDRGGPGFSEGAVRAHGAPQALAMLRHWPNPAEGRRLSGFPLLTRLHSHPCQKLPALSDLSRHAVLRIHHNYVLERRHVINRFGHR